MNFYEMEFLSFFLVTAITWYFMKHEYRWIVGVVSSLYFYYTWSQWFPLLLMIPSLLVFFLTKHRVNCSKLTKNRFILALSAGTVILLFYKSAGLVLDTLRNSGIMSSTDLKTSPFNLILPVGLSFFTFRLISYTSDVYRKIIEPERHLGYFLFYVTFFPQLLAGPIERVKDFLPQMRKKIVFDPDRVISGVELFFWGFFKKFAVSERLLPFVNDCFREPAGKGLTLLFAAWFYSFIIYCDFSGYTDMAIGIARIMGIKSVENFNYPYLSRSITQFWNRWHISLSTWLRDYLFLPLSYKIMGKIESRKLYGIKTEIWGYTGGMLITMILGGFWHGAKWTFIVWGLLHGLFLIVSFLTKKKRKKLVKKLKLNKYPGLHAAINIFTTFNLVTLAWIFFKAESVNHALLFINKISVNLYKGSLGHLVFNSMVIILFLGLENLYKNRAGFLSRLSKPEFAKAVMFAFFICLLMILAVDKTNFFIYMDF